MSRIKLLIVDDHPLIVEGYKQVINNDAKLDVDITAANDCKEAYDLMAKAKSVGVGYDMICLDMNLPGYEKKGLYSGEDLGLIVRKWFSDTKLIVLTMYSDNFRLYNILKNLEPEGFLIKGDIDPTEFKLAIRKCINGEIYYSNTVNTLLRSTVTSDFVLDKIDRAILYYLSKGIKTKDLPQNIPLSLAGIEKRKRIMKEVFDISGGDLILIEYAKRHGFL
ncbi:DNA-binding NarL/FixJ family response regulator [Christiangramia gaetbulicola]|uniref:DNA-binding NarL/FixJ family response regulator n=1 Tax=Christiangramia gaetbulicola TaxID=703340 RepID=A0A2T6AK25_9FLAO|nr:response regulator [Christiangramia gaetbulicola]PTX44173.1 DNA-binding NarL/FixJ family response regulator [Christiangramia gaetbulicola]